MSVLRVLGGYVRFVLVWVWCWSHRTCVRMFADSDIVDMPLGGSRSHAAGFTPLLGVVGQPCCVRHFVWFVRFVVEHLFEGSVSAHLSSVCPIIGGISEALSDNRTCDARHTRMLRMCSFLTLTGSRLAMQHRPGRRRPRARAPRSVNQATSTRGGNSIERTRATSRHHGRKSRARTTARQADRRGHHDRNT